MYTYQDLRVIHPATTSGGAGFYRIINPMVMLKNKGYHQTFLSKTILSNEELTYLNPDSVIWQGQYTTDQIEAMERYRKHKPNLFMTYELGDTLWNIPDQNIFKEDIPSDIKSRLSKIFSIVNTVICSNHALASAVNKAFGYKNTVVVPNSLPFDMYRILKESRTNISSSKPRVGWAGGIAHLGDLAVISDFVNKTYDKYHWVFFGLVPPKVDIDRVEFHPAVPFEQYLVKLKYLNLDVALAPIEKHPFNDTKSNLRVIEYGACGYPIVASDLGPYIDQPCMKVENTTEEWESAVDDIIQHPKLAKSMIDKQFAYLSDNHVTEKHVDLWHTAWGRSNHAPMNAVETDEVVAVSTSGIVFNGNAPMDTYPSIEEAITAKPDASILWVDNTTWVSNTLIAKVMDFVKDTPNIGSVTTLSNRGDFLSFPKIYEVNVLQQDEAKAIVDGLTKYEDNPYVFIPQPSGPVIFMSNKALAKVGLPRINDYPQEFAFSIWGNAVQNVGMEHVAILSEYAYTMNTTPFSKEMMEYGINCIKAYCPEKPHHYAQWNKQYEQYMKKRQSIEILMKKNLPTIPSCDNRTYDDWISWFDSPSKKVVVPYQESKGESVKFGIVLPVYRPNINNFKETLESLKNQYYSNFSVSIVVDDEDPTEELIQTFVSVADDKRFTVYFNDSNLGIVGASNKSLRLLEDKGIDWVLFLDNEDTLPLHCLNTVSREIEKNPKAVIFYTDSDLITKEGKRDSPFFKPDYDYTRLLSQNYFNHLTVYDFKKVSEIGYLKSAYEGSQDYDLVLRYIDKYVDNREHVVHIARILYHWRVTEGSVTENPYAKPYAIESARSAVKDHILRRGEIATVSALPSVPMWTSVRPMVTDQNKKLVSIIIPFKDKIEYLEKCLTSIFSKTNYPLYEVILLNNGSKEKRSKRYLESLRDKRIKILDFPFDFNWSIINNFGSEHANGEYLVFLNDDTEIIEGNWLTEMVGFSAKKEVAFVGARLLYGNGTIQHVGVTVAPNLAYHYDRFKPVSNVGYFGLDQISHEAIAVTGACMMVRKSLFEELGKFDTQFRVCYGDVDICLEAYQKNYKNVVCMTSTLFHHESVTRGAMAQGDKNHYEMMKEMALLQRKRGILRDPYINPNSDMTKNQEAAVWPPLSFEWDKSVEERDWAIAINATDKDLSNLWNEGYLVLNLMFFGGVAKLDFPVFQNIKPWDSFSNFKDFMEFLNKFDYKKTFFFGIKASNPELLEYVSRLFKNVINCSSYADMNCPRGSFKNNDGEYCDNFIVKKYSGLDLNLCSYCIETQGTQYGFVNPIEWRDKWKKFKNNTNALTIN